jgi:hypothetical protein
MSLVNQNTKRMRLVTLLIVAVVVGLRANAAEAAPLGRQLVELESHIKWSAVDNAWKGIRARWVATTAACDGPECVAQQLLDLEAHVKWKAVDAAWTKRRSGWMNDCKAVTTHVESANLLLEFEQNVGWQAVDEGWRARRVGWVAQVKGG